MDYKEYFNLLSYPGYDGGGLGKYTDSGQLVPGGRIDRHWKHYNIDEKEILGFSYKDKSPYLYDTDLMLKEFNLKSIEFGNWVTQEERAGLLYASALSFKHLSEVLQIPPYKIGLGGRLSLALGARGTGGSAKAHFEPFTSFIINLTKPRGKGSLAHEYGHALDNIIGIDNSISRWITDTSRKTYVYPTATAARIAELTRSILKTVKTTKYSNRLFGDYENMTIEIFARLFEYYIALKLQKAGLTNLFLAKRFSYYKTGRIYVDYKDLLKVEPLIDELMREVFSGITY